MKFSQVLAAALLIGICAAAQTNSTATKRKPGATKPGPKTSGKKAAGKSSGRVSTRVRAAAAPARQAVPSVDRYREIQEALAAKGYLTTPATGVWDQDSTNAMKRHQADQKLDSTGKVNARSLITLGLGPKDESLPSNPPNPNK